MTRPGIERRKAARAHADFAIRLAERGELRGARIKDLSTSGLCCLYPEALREMTLVRIALELPGDSTAHEVQGAVVRCAKLRDYSAPTYEVAVFFTQMSPEARRAIDTYVTAQLKPTVSP